MKHSSLFLFFTALLLVFSSCKDDDPAPDKKTLLSNKNWKVTALMLSAPGFPPFDAYSDSEPCDQDDFWRFSDTGSYEMNEGATKCDPNAPQVYERGTWTLDGDTLTMTESGDNIMYEITELSDNTLKMKTQQVFSGVNVTIEYTFTRL